MRQPLICDDFIVMETYEEDINITVDKYSDKSLQRKEDDG